MTKAEAIELGKTRYFTGLPCKYGHIAERMVSTRSCVECKSKKERSRPPRVMTDEQKKHHHQVIMNARRKDPERYQGYTLAWRKRNPEKFLEARRKRQTYRRKNDPIYALRHRVSCLVRQAMKSVNFKKGSDTEYIIGCTNEQLRIHIEKQFLKGMSWENMNEWHIDHIVPISSAKSEADVIALNHHTNLRPLWASENIKKSNKMERLI